MFRPGTNPDDVQPADVLCDFCARPWDGAIPMIEGHRGAAICGDCLARAYRALVLEKRRDVLDHDCVLCREGPADRAALDRAAEPGWRADSGIGLCLRCTRQAAGALHKDPDWGWRKPG